MTNLNFTFPRIELDHKKFQEIGVDFTLYFYETTFIFNINIKHIAFCITN
jgi:hypothetical protein